MVPAGIVDVAPWRDWTAAAGGMLEFLHEHLGWDVWMVTRVVDDSQIVLCSSPAGAVPTGARLRWDESFCHEMVAGRAPRIATVTAVVPAYAARTKGLARDASAYIGVPLVAPDGELFGTLCAVAFRAKPLSATRDLPFVEIAGRMLSTLLAAGLAPPPLPSPRCPTR